jgi:peptidoglycan hydrolase CwlO-like protein
LIEDELQALEKEIAIKRNDFGSEIQQQTAGIDTREEEIAGREKEMTALQKEVESFPKCNKSAVQTAVAEITERLTRDFERDKTLMEAHDGPW